MFPSLNVLFLKYSRHKTSFSQNDPVTKRRRSLTFHPLDMIRRDPNIPSLSIICPKTFSTGKTFPLQFVVVHERVFDYFLQQILHSSYQNRQDRIEPYSSEIQHALTPADGDIVPQLHLGVLHREGGDDLYKQVET